MLAVLLQRPGVVETDAEAAGRPAWALRYAACRGGAWATATARSWSASAALQVGRLNLRLMLERDAGEGYDHAGRGARGRAPRRQPRGAGPDLRAAAAARRRAPGAGRPGCARCAACCTSAARRWPRAWRPPAAAASARSPTSCCCRPSTATSRCSSTCARLSPLHPERLYADCLALAGDLATFRDTRRPPRFAGYRARRPGRHLPPGDRRPAPVAVDGAGADGHPDRTAGPQAYGVRVALIPDVEMQRNATFVLAVSSQLPGDALRARFPTQVKIGPGRAHPRPRQPAAARRRAAPAAGGAAPDSVHTPAATTSSWRPAATSCGSSSKARAASRCTSPATSPGSNSSFGLELWAIRA